MNIQRILVSFDAFFDTRLPVLESIHPEARQRVLANPEYYLREHNNWHRLSGGLVTNAQFDEAWAKRDNEIRWKSIMSGLLPVLLKILTDHDINMRDGVVDADINIEFNIWPYELVDDELLELEARFRQLFGRETTVTFISIPLAELTPAYLTQHYSMAILYEFHEWIKLHAAALYQQQANKFVMIGPRLFEKDVSQLTVEQKQQETIRFRLEHLKYMDFELIEVRCFSQFLPE